MTFDTKTIVQYQDGVPVASSPVPGQLAQSANPMHFGADSNAPVPAAVTELVDGLIDEIRIDSVARSAAWIAADHASQTDAWITYGPTERTQ
jgi:Concanavalin A-like lectin/glucanases superfamily